MQILYGNGVVYKDVTYICYLNAVNGVFTLPVGDPERAKILGDPLPGVVKHLKVGDKIYAAWETADIKLDFDSIRSLRRLRIKNNLSAHDRLNMLHYYLSLNFGNMTEELPEQLMAMRFLKETDTVLELGGNIGRNSCVIASILDDDKRLVVLESNPQHAKELTHNRDRNLFNFNVEASALSKVPLIQKGWITSVNTSNEVPPGYIKVNTISYAEIKEKYGLKFNVLVADCEGALFQILMDDESMLNDIETIIIENDFTTIEPKKYVDSVFTKYGFKSIYSQAGGFGPCYSCFFQVFSKHDLPLY
jgi:FkbM family methyltransferase